MSKTLSDEIEYAEEHANLLRKTKSKRKIDIDADVNSPKRTEPHIDTNTEDVTPAFSNAPDEKNIIEEKESQLQNVYRQKNQQSFQSQKCRNQLKGTEKQYPKFLKGSQRFKSNENDQKFRPISMSQSRSIASKRLDIGTFSLLESLNLIQSTDSNDINEKKDNTICYILPASNTENVVNNGGNINHDNIKNLNDGKCDTTDKDCKIKDNDDKVFCITNQYSNDDGSTSSCDVASPFLVLDSIYPKAAEIIENIEEDSPFKLSKEEQYDKSPPRNAVFQEKLPGINPPIKDEVLKLKGLSREGGILEFCTVNADLSLLLNENNIHKKETKKKSVYDIIDDDNDHVNRLKISSYISPKKSNCLPSEQIFSIDHVHDFCFPSGVPIDFVSKDTANYFTNSSGRIQFFNIHLFFIMIFSTFLFHFILPPPDICLYIACRYFYCSNKQ